MTDPPALRKARPFSAGPRTRRLLGASLLAGVVLFAAPARATRCDEEEDEAWLAEMNRSRSRWTDQDMGDNRFTFHADGTFEQVTESETESTLEHQFGDEMGTQVVNSTNVSTGRWAPADEGKLDVCIETFEGSMTNRMTVGGRTRRSGPHPIPYEPGPGGDRIAYWFICDGDSAEVTQLVDGTVMVTWQAERVP